MGLWPATSYSVALYGKLKWCKTEGGGTQDLKYLAYEELPPKLSLGYQPIFFSKIRFQKVRVRYRVKFSIVNPLNWGGGMNLIR